MQLGSLLLLSLCEGQDAQDFWACQIDRKFFLGEEEGVYDFVHAHVMDYGALPSVHTLRSQFPGLGESHEPPEYYVRKLEDRYHHRSINSTLMTVSDLMSQQKISESRLALRELVNELEAVESRRKIVSLESASDLLVQDYLDHVAGKELGCQFGWPYLDGMVSGLRGGDVVSFVGRPAAGKTWKMIFSAYQMFEHQGKNVLFVSMEMEPFSLIQRISSLHSQFPIDRLRRHEYQNLLGTYEQDQIHATTAEWKSADSKFWFLDGNLQSTPDDIFLIANQLKPDVVFIDGAYLLKHPNLRLDRYTRVAENIERIKHLTSTAKIPTVASYQFNRMASKKKDSDDITLDDIAYSDAIGQVSSIVLGLFEEDTVETFNHRTIRVLKGREGAVGQFKIRWDFEKMDFSEIDDFGKEVDGALKFL